MFRSSGGTGIGLPLSVQQQYLYDKSYDEERTSFGLPEGLLLHEMPQLSPCLTANPNNPSPEIIPLASLSFHHTHRKKPMKKDRHSKIITAQGARDRRMRLSLDIAKRFFYLQDQLGFDKASKTIEWLLNQSRAAINELARTKASGSPENNLSSSEKGGSAGSYTSPTSDGEIASGIDETYPEENRKGNSKEKTPAIFKEKKMSLYRKNIFDPQSRKKARLRARQRTWMKKNFDDTKNLSSASPLETVEDVSSHSMDHQGSYLNIIEESFSSIYSFDCNENVPISRRMNVENLVSKDNSTIKFFMANVNPHFHLSAETAQDRPVSLPLSPTSSAAFTDLPLCSKPWEIFGNQSLY